jgi:hypothetical protein
MSVMAQDLRADAGSDQALNRNAGSAQRCGRVTTDEFSAKAEYAALDTRLEGIASGETRVGAFVPVP